MEEVECNVCMNTKKSSAVSSCKDCGETGVICHICLRSWVSAGHHPDICTICKNPNKTVLNIPKKTLLDLVLYSNLRIIDKLRGSIVVVHGVLFVTSIVVGIILCIDGCIRILISIIKNDYRVQNDE